MGYKYMPISSSIAPNPQATFIDDFNANVNDMFNVASDAWIIQEESTRGTGICDQDVNVRITKAATNLIGNQLGDDFKQLLFNGPHDVTRGSYFSFDSNIWVCVNTNNIKSISSTCTIRRCNNVLRWMDDSGGLQEWYCAIDYEIARAKDNISSSAGLVLLEGLIHVYLQLNDTTATLEANRRFLFGNPTNWVAYRITGGGVNSYQNLQTTDNTSYGLLTLIMNATEKDAQNDDFTNGIANANKYTYTITVSPSSFSGVKNATITLVPTVTLNGEVVSRNVIWSSDTPSKVSVDATTGLVTLLATGTAKIRCTLENNSTVYRDTTITVAGTAPADTFSIEIDPTDNSILVGDTETYTVNLYKNGTVTADTFTFAVDATSTAPVNCYDFTTIDGNNFSIENITMSIGKPVVILATSATSPTHTQLFTINLKGAY